MDKCTYYLYYSTIHLYPHCGETNDVKENNRFVVNHKLDINYHAFFFCFFLFGKNIAINHVGVYKQVYHLYNMIKLSQTCQQDQGICFLTSQFSLEENNTEDTDLDNTPKTLPKELRLLILKSSRFWEEDYDNKYSKSCSKEKGNKLFPVYTGNITGATGCTQQEILVVL